MADDDENEGGNKSWYCRHCGASGKTPNPPYLCPVCGKPNVS